MTRNNMLKKIEWNERAANTRTCVCEMSVTTKLKWKMKYDLIK